MHTRLLYYIIILGLSYNFTVLYSQDSKISLHQRNLVILGNLDIKIKNRDTTRTPIFLASGFIIEIDGINHLVTAKHVVTLRDQSGNLTNNINPDSKFLFSFYQKKDGTMGHQSLKEIQDSFRVEWMFHSDPRVDIAILPYPIDTLIDNVVVIKNDFLLGSKEVFELDPVFFVSYHPGLSGVQDLNPIFRSGVISKINNDRTILLDAFAFPGNSGSPVFLAPTFLSLGTGGIIELGKNLRQGLVGVVGEYYAYQDIAVSSQTGRPRIIFEENSGIARIWTTDFLREIFGQDNMRMQLKRIKIMKY